MSDRTAHGPGPWGDALGAAALLAADPVGLGGVALRALPGPVRDAWLAHLRALLPAGAAWRRMPLHIGDLGLLGGLDLAATLRAGRPIAVRGLLADADGGILLIAMAERLTAGAAGRVAAAQDSGLVAVERDGLAFSAPARFGVVALDEGLAEDERPPAALLDRLAFWLDLASVPLRHTSSALAPAEAVAAARERLAAVEVPPETVEALCAAAAALGIASLRASFWAVRAARASAALAGRAMADAQDAALAARLVLAPRACALPPAEDAVPPEAGEPEDPGASPPAEDRPAPEDQEPALEDQSRLEELVLAAAKAAIPADLLAQLRLAAPAGGRAGRAGRAGPQRQPGGRGRPAGVRVGAPRAGQRLDLVDTLRAAAPWQPLRRRERGSADAPAAAPLRVEVRPEDFRVRRFKARAPTVTIFLVDASGSAALHRLAEAKGAVELVLAECYVRRDRVALVAFRGRAAELILPPTRSLVRAKRSLAGLPGGGATPLAAGIDAGLALADTVRRAGETPVLVLLTDGRANIGRDGSPGRERAQADALAAARRLQQAGFAALLVDTAPQPQASARGLASAMHATYLPLPHADAAGLSRVVQTAAAAGRPGPIAAR